MPSVPMAMPSVTVMVLNSMGVPPAARIPSFTFTARARWFQLQGVISIQQWATPTSGLARSSSVNPTALKYARAAGTVGAVEEDTAVGARVGRHSGLSLWGRGGTLPRPVPARCARATVQSAPNEKETVKALTRTAAALALCASLPALAQDTPLYRDRTRPVDERVRDLLARMTLDEKVAQTLGIWKGKEKITDEKGGFDPAGARALIPNGLGQIWRGRRSCATSRRRSCSAPARTPSSSTPCRSG